MLFGKCHVEAINDLCYNTAGDLLASGSDDCTVRVWTQSGQFHSSLNIHNMRVTHVRWLGTRGSLVSLSAEHVYIWHNPGSDQLETVLLKRNRVTSLDFSPDGGYLASVSEETLMVWSVDDVMDVT